MLTTRRQALKTLTATIVSSTALGQIPTFVAAATSPSPDSPAGPYKLPPLPYGYDVLEPAIDELTMHLHHDKHHQTYVNKLNEAVAKEPSFTPAPNVDDLLKNLAAVPESIRTAVRNQGGGHSNHSLFWQTLSPKPSAPNGDFAKALQDDLGGLDAVKEAMTKAGAGIFGSGWVWLVLDGGRKLTVMTLPNQDSPLTEGHYPLFGIDVWEHAYYLKYHNVRAEYLKAIWSVTNWEFISDRYAAALKT